jgi:hypothetical protein
VTPLGESVSVEDMSDELCGMTVVPLAVGVTAHDPFVRFVPLTHDPARRLRLKPAVVLVVRHDSSQIAVLAEWAGFDLVDKLR